MKLHWAIKFGARAGALWILKYFRAFSMVL